jgi:hypothetical protein
MWIVAAEKHTCAEPQLVQPLHQRRRQVGTRVGKVMRWKSMPIGDQAPGRGAESSGAISLHVRAPKTFAKKVDTNR